MKRWFTIAAAATLLAACSGEKGPAGAPGQGGQDGPVGEDGQPGAGYVAQATGWPLFFVISVVVAVPSLILLAWLQRRGHFDGLGPVRV